MARLPTSYKEIEAKEPHLDSEDYKNIERQARVLSLDECYLYLGCEVKELSTEELELAERVWNRGRMAAIGLAGERFFAQMSQRGGAVPALEYLQQMSGTFQAEVVPNAVGAGFSFSVNIPETKDKEKKNET